MSRYMIFYASPLIIDVRGIENHIIEVEAPDLGTAVAWFLKFSFDQMLPTSPAMCIIPSEVFREMPEADMRLWWDMEVARMVSAGTMSFVRVEDMSDD